MGYLLQAQFQIERRGKGTEVYLGMQKKQSLPPLCNFQKCNLFSHLFKANVIHGCDVGKRMMRGCWMRHLSKGLLEAQRKARASAFL